MSILRYHNVSLISISPKRNATALTRHGYRLASNLLQDQDAWEAVRTLAEQEAHLHRRIEILAAHAQNHR